VGEPRRILVLSASVGAGHLRAAEGVEAACRIRYPAAEVRNLDVLTLTPAPFRRMYGKGYPIPGQETRNATMLYEAGAAISGENPYTIGYRVASLLASTERRQAMRDAARRRGRPRAALEVAEELGHLGQPS